MVSRDDAGTKRSKRVSQGGVLDGARERSLLRYGTQPGLDLVGFPRALGRGLLVLGLLSHEPALLQQPVDDDPVGGHHVAPGPLRPVFVEHRLGYAQRFQRPSGVRLGLGERLVAAGGRVSAPLAVHRVVVEPALVRGRLLQPVRLQHVVHVVPVVGRRVQHRPCATTKQKPLINTTCVLI